MDRDKPIYPYDFRNWRTLASGKLILKLSRQFDCYEES